MKRHLSILLLAVALAVPAFAKPAPAKKPAAPATAAKVTATKVTSVEGITEYTLPNGLHVLLFPDPTKPTITVNVTYLVGSRNEGYGETGMAHLLEHMLFKGTPKHPNIPQELTAHGARPNGSTWFDRTNYFETFSATDENLDWALALESDRMVHSNVAKKDLDSEMTVVRNEYESGENDPESILEERTLESAYIWHNYAHPTIGARSDIENVPIERLQAFYRKYYQPDNAVLLVAGKFDDAKTLALIEKYFGAIPKPKRVLEAPYTLEPTQDGERSVTLRRVGDVQAVTTMYHVPSGADADFAAIDVLTYLLGDSPSGRLYKALVETNKAASVSSYAYQLHDPGVLVANAEVRKEQNLDEVRDILIKTVEAVISTPPTKEEVDRAKTAIQKSFDLTINRSDRVGLTLSEWEGMGDWRLFFLHRDRVQKVTPEDVQRVAQKYLKASNRTVGLFVPTEKPDRAEIPPPVDVAALVKDYKGAQNVKTGEAFDPSTTNIDSRTTRFTLPNGMKVAFVPKQTRGGSVVATMNLHYGDEPSLQNRSVDAVMAGEMLRRGTAKHTRQQIEDELDRIKTRLSVGGGATSASASVETIHENLPAAIKLLAEILREPVFPANEFEQLRQEELSASEQQLSDPQAIADIEFSRYENPYPKGDPRYTSTTKEDIEELKAAKLDSAKDFFSKFYGGSNAELAIVGDFDANEMKALVTQLFGDWKSPSPFKRLESKYFDIPGTEKTFETPDKANGWYFGGLNLKIRDDNPDFPALVLGNYMLGGGFLNSRLATRVRQKEGLSYGVGSVFSASPLDESGSWMAYAIYAPQNVAKLKTAIREEVERMLKDGFTAEEIAAAKSGYLQSRQVSRSQDNELVRQLASNLYLDRTMKWYGDLEAKISALTPQQANEAMRRWIDPSKLAVFVAGDFAKNAAAAPKP